VSRLTSSPPTGSHALRLREEDPWPPLTGLDTEFAWESSYDASWPDPPSPLMSGFGKRIRAITGYRRFDGGRRRVRSRIRLRRHRRKAARRWRTHPQMSTVTDERAGRWHRCRHCTSLYTHSLSLSLVLRPGEKRNEVGFKGGCSRASF
jgi:hypothetical protein